MGGPRGARRAGQVRGGGRRGDDRLAERLGRRLVPDVGGPRRGRRGGLLRGRHAPLTSALRRGAAAGRRADAMIPGTAVDPDITAEEPAWRRTRGSGPSSAPRTAPGTTGWPSWTPSARRASTTTASR